VEPLSAEPTTIAEISRFVEAPRLTLGDVRLLNRLASADFLFHLESLEKE
jgi:hypothetical protein